MTYPFRIFISYSHEDAELARHTAAILAQAGCIPLWDANIRPGTAFTEEIKRLIHHAHIFMPLLTENSTRRPWVHQETGYATALNIPILPVAVGSVPGEMVSQLQAMSIQQDFSDFNEKLANIDLERIVLSPQAELLSSVEISDWSERRTQLLAQDCRLVTELGYNGRVRQRASLSSFSIPDKDPSNPIWSKRDGNVPRDPYFHNLLRDERRELEKHARKEGCRLIIDPTFCLERNGAEATQTRLKVLVEFIESMPEDKIEVAMSPQARGANLTVLGDWFSAESVSPHAGEGHRQTVFTWHPPTVLGVMRRFDEQFDEITKENGIDPAKSRSLAIQRINEIIQTGTLK